jgi:2-isopropylmalate synthase
VDPGLDFSDVGRTARIAEHCTRMPVPARQPYAGELVFTAFSGSHQDAIKKGLAALRRSRSPLWEVPYLPIDPADVGRGYEPVVRVNSQSGKGGVAFVMKEDHGYDLPRGLQIEFASVIQAIAERTEEEVPADVIWKTFEGEYMGRRQPLELVRHRSVAAGEGAGAAEQGLVATLRVDGEEREVQGFGNGPIDAFLDALRSTFGVEARLTHYSEHALGSGADAAAVAYVELTTPDGGSAFGVGRHPSIVTASLEAVLCAVNRTKG